MGKTLLFLRKPLRPIIYSTVFCVLSLVAFIFSLQFELDSIAIKENVNNYSYVGTIIDNSAGTPELCVLPKNLIEKIANSKSVKEVEKRSLFSAKAENTNAILEYFITDDTIDMYGMLEGFIWPNNDYDPEVGYETALLTVQKNWAGVLKGQSDVDIYIWHDDKFPYDPNNPMFLEGEHVFLTGRFMFDRTYNGMCFTRMSLRYPGIHCPFNVLDDNPVIIIPNEFEREETDAFIEEELNKRGMLKLKDMIGECSKTFNVKPVRNTSMLMPFSKHSVYICDGRGITEEDYGKKVCMINQIIANKNSLNVGDKIKLSLSDTCFVCDCVTHDAKWESGYPKVNDTVPEYGEMEEYEIVGIYNFYLKRNVEEDLLSFSRNDIFIPTDVIGVSDYDNAKTTNFSFKVYGPDYEDFMDEVELDVYENGCALMLVDAGWEEFSDNYRAIMGRRIVSLVSSIVIFIAAIILFIVLLLRHFKYEYGLCRLLGAKSLEATKVYLAGYFVLAIPALIISLLGTMFVYAKWLSPKMAEVIEKNLPNTFESFLICGKWGLGALFFGFLLLFVIALFNGKKNLLSMIK